MSHFLVLERALWNVILYRLNRAIKNRNTEVYILSHLFITVRDSINKFLLFCVILYFK